MKVAVGFLVSYDFKLLQLSIPLVYPHVHKIVLAIDANRQTLKGAPYEFDETFKDWVTQLDTDHKIEWLEESFFKEGLTPLEVVIAERNLLLEKMKPADWFIQLDADEYFIDFDRFLKFLETLPTQHSEVYTISVKWKTIFKAVDDGYLLIAGRTERVPIATNLPFYKSERGNEDTTTIDADCNLLHQSWARTPAEIKEKVMNWSHANDFDTMQFFNNWLSCNQKNYKQFINFHPIQPLLWPRLDFKKAGSIPELINYYIVHPPGEEVPNAKPLIQRLKSQVKKLITKS